MYIPNKKILLGFTLLIFLLLIGTASAHENITENAILQDSDVIEESQLDYKLTEAQTNLESSNDESIGFDSNVTSGVGSLSVEFNGSSTDENVVDWSWDFGDGNTGTGQNVTHKYTTFGLYDVTLKTQNSNGILNNFTKNDYISVFYEGSAFLNPKFEELGDKQSSSQWGVSGWIIDDSPITQVISIKKFDLSNRNLPRNTYCLYVPKQLTANGGQNTYAHADVGFGQYIDFDCVDNITFWYCRSGTGYSNMSVTIGEYQTYLSLETYFDENNRNGFTPITIDTSNIKGVKLFRMYCYEDVGTETYKWFYNFTCGYNNLTHSEFTYEIDNIIDNQITLNFTNRGYGLITNFIWDFGDGNTSNELNPTHIFTSGNYTVKLTASNANYSKTYSYDLVLEFPSINGKIYKTMQEAIDNASDGDVIDVPVDLSENIIINKNLTLNFNGNKLISSGSSPVIQVTGGAQATIKNVTLENSNVLATDDESSLTITESNFADTNITLNAGNIALDGNEFNCSFITVVNANAIIVNNNIANGGIKVNGGKSKINNNVLSGNDVAITQTKGETNIISNIITDNNIGVNITNGTANINFNVIYNNNNVALTYVGSVDASNNWFGVFQATFSNAVFEGYVDVYAPDAEQPVWLVLTLNCNETTLSSAQNYAMGVDLTLNSKGENTSSLGTLPKFSLPVSTRLGQASEVNVENSIGEFTLTTTTLTSDDAIFTINGEDYTLDVNIFKIEDRINELETQLVDAQANASQLASKLDEANKKVENLTNQLNETQANATKLAEDLADANQKADNLTTQLSEAQKQIQTLSVDPISTTIAANSLTIKALDSGNIQVTLKDANNNLLANKDVQVIINGVVYNGKTGDNGVAKIAVKFSSAGTYYATVSFAGDNTYKSSIGTSKVVVSKKASKITSPKKTFKAKVKTKKVKITLKSGSTVLKSKKITLKVNGKTYTAKTNNKGVATIKVTKLTKKGTFTYTVKFAGDKAYNAITKKGKITIK
jgi:PKD repeat protein/multidrug efflux pump subunit AcrA (membrane-fusion protein)